MLAHDGNISAITCAAITAHMARFAVMGDYFGLYFKVHNEAPNPLTGQIEKH